VGYLGGVATTYGWVATRAASIGELSIAFTLPSGDRYLWDFATDPDQQGQGLYPRLLQAIVREEQADRFAAGRSRQLLPERSEEMRRVVS
jgi:ribosomal protein S18 acetylase RimI-like enzyme